MLSCRDQKPEGFSAICQIVLFCWSFACGVRSVNKRIARMLSVWEIRFWAVRPKSWRYFPPFTDSYLHALPTYICLEVCLLVDFLTLLILLTLLASLLYMYLQVTYLLCPLIMPVGLHTGAVKYCVLKLYVNVHVVLTAVVMQFDTYIK